MCRRNLSHLQNQIFTPMENLPEKIKSKMATHWSSLFYEKVFLVIKEDDFSEIYCGNNGRANFPVNIFVGLDIIKDLFDYTDEKLYDDFFLNSGIQRALGIYDISKWYFSIRTWYNFQRSLLEYEIATKKDLIGDLFKDHRDDLIKELGIKTDKQRRDSVMISANIKRMNRLMLFHKVLSNLVNILVKLEYTQAVMVFDSPIPDREGQEGASRRRFA